MPKGKYFHWALDFPVVLRTAPSHADSGRVLRALELPITRKMTLDTTNCAKIYSLQAKYRQKLPLFLLAPLSGIRLLLPAGVMTILMMVAPVVIIIMCFFGLCDIITAPPMPSPPWACCELPAPHRSKGCSARVIYMT